MKKSTHRVEVVRINPEPHPNADSLVIQKVYGYQVCLRKEDWVGVELGAYIQPDCVVDTDRKEFTWLKGKPFREAIPGDLRFHKVCAVRLRDVLSYGLMVPAPEGSKEGDDVSDLLGVTRYEPTLVFGETEPPPGYHVEYDLEALQRYGKETFTEGEDVLVFEKLDGVNARYCFEDGKMHVGSKGIWLEQKDSSPWWKILNDNPDIETICRKNGVTLYGEIIGFPGGHKTKKRYGVPAGQAQFHVFDVLNGDSFMNYMDVLTLLTPYNLPVVPLVSFDHFNLEKIMAMADGPSLVIGANHDREGIVVRPKHERRSLFGRTVLKMVSGRSLMG